MPPRRPRGAEPGAPDPDAPPPVDRPPESPPPALADDALLNRESPWSAFDERRVAPERLFTRSHYPIPALDPRTWRLVLAGELEWPGSIGLGELDSRPQRSVAAVLECAGNGRRRFGTVVAGEVPWGEAAVGAAEWSGVPLRDLLRDAGVRPSTKEVLFVGADGLAAQFDRPVERYARSLPLETAMGSDDILVATSMNGVPLEAEHGAPARLLVPGWYGMASVKWLVRVEALDHAFEGRFQTDRYVFRHQALGSGETTPVRQLRVKSLIVSPTEGAEVRVGETTIVRGRAWSGSGAILRVEVDLGSGWEPAGLAPGSGPHDWTAWSKVWTPRQAGPVELRARAADEAGYTQPDAAEPNDFQYAQNAVHRVRVQAVE
jgi:DMSO/TMAO reductase YedYZ molybdopterin-dependent catalytic subunit